MGRELKRVPLTFDWPMRTTWAGYLNPFYVAKECEDCGGTGYAPEARRFSDQWYGDAAFDPEGYGATPLTVDHHRIVAMATRNVEQAPDFYLVAEFGRDHAIRRECLRLWSFMGRQWSHHLIQADVDALVAEGRLMDFTHVPRTREQREVVRAKMAAGGNSWLPEPNGYRPTSAEVNDWSIGGMGHDSINKWVCVKERCRREGAEIDCPGCGGNGVIWPSKAHEALYESYEKIDPPDGDGYQLWETTSAGSPISPVFSSLEELCAWAADNATTFADETATAEEWMKMLAEDFVHHRDGNAIFT